MWVSPLLLSSLQFCAGGSTLNVVLRLSACSYPPNMTYAAQITLSILEETVHIFIRTIGSQHKIRILSSYITSAPDRKEGLQILRVTVNIMNTQL